MTSYSDNVGSSNEKLRSVLSEALLNGFSSTLSDNKSKKLAEEIVNTILLELETFLIKSENTTIDQISGRIQTKLKDIGANGIKLSDESIQKIVDAVNDNKDKTSESGENNSTSDITSLKAFFDNDEQDKQVEEYSKDKKDIAYISNFLNDVLYDLTFFDDYLLKIQDIVSQINKPTVSLFNKTKAPSLNIVKIQKLIEKTIKDAYAPLLLSNKILAASNYALAGANVILAGANIALAASNIVLAGSQIVLAASNIVLAVANVILAGAKLILAASNIMLAVTNIGLMLTIITTTISLMLTVITAAASIIVSVLGAALSVVLAIAGLIVADLLAAATVTIAILTATASLAIAMVAQAALLAIPILTAAAAISIAILTAGSLIAISVLTVGAGLILAAGTIALAIAAIAAPIALLTALIILLIVLIVGITVFIVKKIMDWWEKSPIKKMIDNIKAGWNKIKNWWDNVDFFKSIEGAWNSLKNTISGWFKDFHPIDAITNAWNSLCSTISGWFKDFHPLESVGKIFDNIGKVFSDWWNKCDLKQWIDKVKNWWDNVKLPTIDSIIQGFTDWWNKSALKQWIDKAMDWWDKFSISNMIDAIWKGILGILYRAIAGIFSGLSHIWGLGDSMSALAKEYNEKADALKTDKVQQPQIGKSLDNIEQTQQQPKKELTLASQEMADEMQKEKEANDFKKTQDSTNMISMNNSLLMLNAKLDGLAEQTAAAAAGGASAGAMAGSMSGSNINPTLEGNR